MQIYWYEAHFEAHIVIRMLLHTCLVSEDPLLSKFHLDESQIPVTNASETFFRNVKSQYRFMCNNVLDS